MELNTKPATAGMLRRSLKALADALALGLCLALIGCGLAVFTLVIRWAVTFKF